MSNLKHSTRRAIAWSAADKIAQQVVFLSVSVLLMWWLEPGDFAPIGELALYTALANILLEGGFSAALIRKVDATQRDFDTVFWFNFGLGVFFCLLLWFAAPRIADFNGHPELVWIGRTLFLSIPINSLGMIHQTQLVKRSNFKRLGAANVASVAVAGIVAVAMAATGFRTWALVCQLLAATAVKSAALWWLTGWRPRLAFSRASFGKLFGFSCRLMLGNIVATFSSNFYLAALGTRFDANSKGSYYNAGKLRDAVVLFLMHVFGQSLYLMLSNLQHDAGRFVQALRKSVRTISFLLFPALLGLGVVARPLLGLFPDGKWLGAVPLLHIGVFSGILVVLQYIYANALKVKGRSDITLIFDLVNGGLLLLFFFGAVRHGLQAVIGADALARFFVMAGYMVVAHRLLGYRIGQQLRDLAPYAVLAAAMCAGIWPLKFVIGNPVLLLAAQLGLGAVFYLGVSRLLGSKVLADAVEAVRKRG